MNDIAPLDRLRLWAAGHLKRDWDLQRDGLTLFDFAIPNGHAVDVPDRGQTFEEMVDEALRKWQEIYGVEL